MKVESEENNNEVGKLRAQGVKEGCSCPGGGMWVGEGEAAPAELILGYCEGRCGRRGR